MTDIDFLFFTDLQWGCLMDSTPDFETIYKLYFSKIKKYLTRLIGEYHAEDVTQEVFNKVNKNLTSLKQGSKVSTWLYRIATNTAIDKTRTSAFKQSLKSRANDETNSLEDQNAWTGKKDSSTDLMLIKEEMRDCVQEFIHRLPDDYKTILILREYEGRKNKEIAQILGVSIHTAKIRYHRAKEMLKKELDLGCVFYHDHENRLLCDRKQVQSILPNLPE